MKRLTAALLSSLLTFPLFACGEEPAKVAPPPPLPTMPTPATAAPAAEAAPPAAADEKLPEPKPSKPSKREKAKQAKAEAAAAKAEANAAKAEAAAAAKAQKPAAATPTPAPAKPSAPAAPTPAKGKVVIPRTAHVNISVPPGLQADLDKDVRMQPWANQVVSVIDKCHTQNPNTAGTIEVQITMHENARPDADIKKLPGELSPIVACATGGLMRTKMPLFTGAEGTRYTVKINFGK